MASRYQGGSRASLKCEWYSAGCSFSLLWVDLQLAHAQGSSKESSTSQTPLYLPLKSPYKVENDAPDHLKKR